MRADQRCRHRGRIGEARERADANNKRQDQRADAVGADAAVPHDRKFVFAGRTAAESVGGVGKAVLVQGAGYTERRRDRERRRRPGRHTGARRYDIDHRADDADDEAGKRKRPDGARDFAVRERARVRER